MHAILVAFYGTKKQCRMLQQQVDALLGAFAAAQPITGQSSMSYSGQNAVFTVSMAAFADGNVWPDETKG